MQIKKNMLLGVCLALSAALSATGWVPQDIDRVCSVRFPAAPQITQTGEMHDYIYNTDTGSYMVQVRAIPHRGVIGDTATLYAFYKGVQNGIIRGYNASLISSKRMDIAGLHGLQVEFTRGSQNHQAVSAIARILLLNDHMIVYSFSAPYLRFAAQQKSRDYFFASFSVDGGVAMRQVNDTIVNATDVHLSAPAPMQAPTSAHAELVKPNTLHFIISFAVSVMLLAAIVYIIVSRRKKGRLNDLSR